MRFCILKFQKITLKLFDTPSTQLPIHLRHKILMRFKGELSDYEIIWSYAKEACLIM